MLETENLAPLRIDPGHHMTDNTVFSCGIHSLKNQQHSVAVISVMNPLQFAQILDMRFQQLLIVNFGLIEPVDACRSFVEIDLLPFLNQKIITLYRFHYRIVE